MTVRVVDDIGEITSFLRDAGWTDGLPVVPPALALVEAMIDASGRQADEVIATLPPRGGEATVERIAANAVMAGCPPSAAPLLLAAVEAVADPAFNLMGVQATTHPCGTLIVASGPGAGAAGVVGGEGCFGPGPTANLAVGRALRLVLMNVGGAQPGVTDRSCQATPAKIGYCITEDLTASPWPPIHVDEGWPEAATTVTVLAAEGPHNIQDHMSTTAEGILDTVGGALCNVGSNNFAQALGHLNGRVGEEWQPRLAVVLGPEHAGLVASAGLTRADVRRELWERSHLPWTMVPRDWRSGLPEGTAVPATPRPDDILLLVAGGAGKHSCWIPTMGSTTPVTRPVRS